VSNSSYFIRNSARSRSNNFKNHRIVYFFAALLRNIIFKLSSTFEENTETNSTTITDSDVSDHNRSDHVEEPARETVNCASALSNGNYYNCLTIYEIYMYIIYTFSSFCLRERGFDSAVYVYISK